MARIEQELESSDFCYSFRQELEDCNTTAESIAEELGLDLIAATLTVGFFRKDRIKTSGLEGLSSKDIKKRRKKDLKPKALN